MKANDIINNLDDDMNQCNQCNRWFNKNELSIWSNHSDSELFTELFTIGWIRVCKKCKWKGIESFHREKENEK